MVKFYLCDIYPETIKKALFNSKIVDSVTGKFLMLVKFNSTHDQYLEMNIELKSGVQGNDSLHKEVALVITQQLLTENSGYRHVYERIGVRAVPEIVFWLYEDPTYFKPGIKQKWVKK